MQADVMVEVVVLINAVPARALDPAAVHQLHETCSLRLLVWDGLSIMAEKLSTFLWGHAADHFEHCDNAVLRLQWGLS